MSLLGCAVYVGLYIKLFIELIHFLLLGSIMYTYGLSRETDESADLKTPAAQF